MKTLYLHVGAAKTGTTAIQYYFSQHASSHSLPYLPIAKQYQGQHGIVAALMGEQRFDWLAAYEKARLVGELKVLESSGEDRYFASSEAIATFDFVRLGGLEQIRELFRNWNVQVIYYVRNQCSLVESTFLQVAKTGAFYGSLSEWYQEFKTKRMGCFASMAKCLGQAFEPTNVHVVSFDDCSANLLGPLEGIASVSLDHSKVTHENRSSILVSLLLQSVAEDTGVRLIGPKGVRLRKEAEKLFSKPASQTLLSSDFREEISADFREENVELEELCGVRLNNSIALGEKALVDASCFDIEAAKSKLLISFVS